MGTGAEVSHLAMTGASSTNTPKHLQVATSQLGGQATGIEAHYNARTVQTIDQAVIGFTGDGETLPAFRLMHRIFLTYSSLESSNFAYDYGVNSASIFRMDLAQLLHIESFTMLCIVKADYKCSVFNFEVH